MDDKEPPHILVTGGGGYIGSHVALALLDEGFRVTVLDNLSTGFREAVPSRATFVEGNVGDESLVGSLIRNGGVEAVIHLAGSVVVPESVARPLDYYANNTVASRALIAAAVAGGAAHFIFSSTAAVYDACGRTTVDEDSPCRPITPYGWSKLMTEQMLADAAAAHPINFAILRYFNVAGADPAARAGQSTAGATHLIKVAVETALGKRPAVEIFGSDYPTADGTGVRDYIHVSDLADAHRLALGALRADRQRSLTLNCGYGRGFSVLEVLDTVDRVAETQIPRFWRPRRPGDAAALVANATRLRRDLGWQPQHDNLEAIVRHALAWEARLDRNDFGKARAQQS